MVESRGETSEHHPLRQGKPMLTDHSLSPTPLTSPIYWNVARKNAKRAAHPPCVPVEGLFGGATYLPCVPVEGLFGGEIITFLVRETDLSTTETVLFISSLLSWAISPHPLIKVVATCRVPHPTPRPPGIPPKPCLHGSSFTVGNRPVVVMSYEILLILYIWPALEIDWFIQLLEATPPCTPINILPTSRLTQPNRCFLDNLNQLPPT